jgi:site-specific DNA recombinase
VRYIPEMTICAIYARYSSELQSPASITDQIRKCIEFAARHQGWAVADEHLYTDEAQSGTGMDRAGLARMMAAATSGRAPFDILLVDDTSRLSRNLSDATRIFERLKYAGVRSIAVSQGIDSENEQAELLVAMHGIMDAGYVRELAHKTHRGLEGCVLRGLHAGGRCFGYRNERVDETSGRLVIEPSEAVIVRRIFEMAADGASFRVIAHTLNAEGIVSPRPRRGRIAGGWCQTAIRAILHNERYVGRIIWNRAKFIKRPGSNKRTARPRPRTEWRIVEAPETRIVDDALWRRVEERLAFVKRTYGRVDGHSGLFGREASSPYLLSGLLVCAGCGARMVVRNGKGPNGKYECPLHRNRGTCTNALAVRRDVIETQLLAGLQREVLAPAIVDLIAEELGRHLRRKEARGDAAATRKRRAEIESEVRRLTVAIAEGGHSAALLAAIAERERELATLAPPPVTMPKTDDLRGFVARQVTDLRSLVSEDVKRARLKLAQFVGEVRMVPTTAGYVAEGNWNLLGGLGGSFWEHCGGWI